MGLGKLAGAVRSIRRLAGVAIPVLAIAALLTSCAIGNRTQIAQLPRTPQKATPTTVKGTPGVAGVPELITHSIVEGEAVAASGQLFWLDSRDGGRAVYGYDPPTQNKFLVSGGNNFSLRSDGTQITWLLAPGRDGKLKVQRYDPAGKQQRMIATFQVPAASASSFEGFPGFAADAHSVYYIGWIDAVKSGLYAIDLATGKEQLITAIDTTTPSLGPVAADSILLWPEVTYTGDAPHTKLHARQADGTDRVLADADGCAQGYAISGSRVVWTMDCATVDKRVFLADLQSGETKAVSSDNPVDQAAEPLISGNLVAWISEPSGAPGTTNRWSLMTYDVTNGTMTEVLTATDELYGEAIVDQDAVAFTRLSDQGLDLFLVHIK